MQFKFRNQSGASIIEYAIALAILAVVFLVFSVSLRRTGQERAAESVNSVRSTTPCGGRLTGDLCR